MGNAPDPDLTHVSAGPPIDGAACTAAHSVTGSAWADRLRQTSHPAAVAPVAQPASVPAHGSARWEHERQQWNRGATGGSNDAEMPALRAAASTAWPDDVLDDLMETGAALETPIPLAELVEYLNEIWAEGEL